MTPDLTRREAVVQIAGSAAAAMLLSRLSPARTFDDPEPLPLIALGKTGRTLPRLGLGCHPIGALAKDEDAIAVLHRAMDVGVRYFDTAPSYGDGRSERRVGTALKTWLKDHTASKREDFYIATKTLHRDGTKARKELDASLDRLGLEYVDCLQCHEVHNDWESLFADDGVVNALNKARDEKRIRHLGITGHRNPKWVSAAITRLPPKADGSGFVTALVPVNPVDVRHMSFVREFLPRAAELGVCVIAMKIFGGGFLLSHMTEDGKKAYTPEDLIRYALAQQAVGVVVPGCDSIEQVAADHAALAPWKQPDGAFLTELEKRAPPHLGKKTEWYKE